MMRMAKKIFSKCFYDLFYAYFVALLCHNNEFFLLSSVLSLSI